MFTKLFRKKNSGNITYALFLFQRTHRTTRGDKIRFEGVENETISLRSESEEKRINWLVETFL